MIFEVDEMLGCELGYRDSVSDVDESDMVVFSCFYDGDFEIRKDGDGYIEAVNCFDDGDGIGIGTRVFYE